ncbi:Uncharacterised protein [Bordetella pertussis]|nr:Uncharacterised protein [Bordetella pertussis]
MSMGDLRHQPKLAPIGGDCRLDGAQLRLIVGILAVQV